MTDQLHQPDRYPLTSKHDSAWLLGLGPKVFLYAEAKDGAISAVIFSRTAGEQVRFRFALKALKSLVYDQ